MGLDMKTIITVWLGFVLVACAQTNLISTNLPATNSITQKQKVVVTKETVLQGLTTISNQISALTLSLKQMDSQRDKEATRLMLVRTSGQGGNMDADESYLQQKYGPPKKLIKQKIAALRLQDFDIRQRYANLLK